MQDTKKLSISMGTINKDVIKDTMEKKIIIEIDTKTA